MRYRKRTDWSAYQRISCNGASGYCTWMYYCKKRRIKQTHIYLDKVSVRSNDPMTIWWQHPWQEGRNRSENAAKLMLWSVANFLRVWVRISVVQGGCYPYCRCGKLHKTEYSFIGQMKRERLYVCGSGSRGRCAGKDIYSRNIWKQQPLTCEQDAKDWGVRWWSPDYFGWNCITHRWPPLPYPGFQ